MAFGFARVRCGKVSHSTLTQKRGLIPSASPASERCERAASAVGVASAPRGVASVRATRPPCPELAGRTRTETQGESRPPRAPNTACPSNFFVTYTYVIHTRHSQQSGAPTDATADGRSNVLIYGQGMRSATVLRLSSQRMHPARAQPAAAACPAVNVPVQERMRPQE